MILNWSCPVDDVEDKFMNFTPKLSIQSTKCHIKTIMAAFNTK